MDVFIIFLFDYLSKMIIQISQIISNYTYFSFRSIQYVCALLQ